jgi:uncharacterized protein involved in high-affinity Fe2+ transport
MMALLQRTIVATAMLAALLAGCAAGSIGGSVGDTMPEAMGGLPAGAPSRPNVTNRQYPAVYDRPAPRSTDPMSEEDQVKLEKDLQALRDRQNAAAKDDGTAPVPTPAAKPAAKKQAGAKTADPKADTKTSDGKTSGAKTSGAKPNP